MKMDSVTGRPLRRTTQKLQVLLVINTVQLTYFNQLNIPYIVYTNIN